MSFVNESTTVVRDDSVSVGGAKEYFDDVTHDHIASTLVPFVVSEATIPAGQDYAMRIRVPHDRPLSNGWFGAMRPALVDDFYETAGADRFSNLNQAGFSTYGVNGGAWEGAMSFTGSQAPTPRPHWVRNASNTINGGSIWAGAPAGWTDPWPALWTDAWFIIRRINNRISYYMQLVDGGPEYFMNGGTAWSVARSESVNAVKMVIALSSRFSDAAGTVKNCRTEIQWDIGNGWEGGEWDAAYTDSMILTPRGGQGGAVITPPSIAGTETVTSSQKADGTIDISIPSAVSNWAFLVYVNGRQVQRIPGNQPQLINLGKYAKQGDVIEVRIEGSSPESTIPLAPQMTLTGDAAVWADGSEIVIDSTTTDSATIDVPQAAGAVTHHIFVNDVEVESVAVGVLQATVTTVDNGDVVRVEAKGVDGVLTTDGPELTLILGVGPTTPTTHATMTFDPSAIDLSGILPSAVRNDDFKSLTTNKITTTSAGAVNAINNAAPGTHIEITSPTLTMGNVSTDTQQVLQPQGTVDAPIVVSGPNHLDLNLNVRARIEGSGNLIFEGAKMHNCGGSQGPIAAYAPGCVIASCDIKNIYSTPMYLGTDTTGAGHWSGIYNSELNFAIARNFSTPLNIQNVSATQDAGNTRPTIVGAFLAHCRIINQNAAGVLASGWGGVAWDPVHDTYLGNQDTLTRAFFLTFDGTTSGDELISMKRNGFHIHGVHCMNGAAQVTFRYTHDSYMTGCTTDQNGSFRTVRIAGHNHVGRMNAFYNTSSGRGVQFSVEDNRPDSYGPANDNTLQHNYPASKDNRWTDNVFDGSQYLGALYGPISTETAPAIGNISKNVHLDVSALAMYIAKRYSTGALPNQDAAQWDIDNPEATNAVQTYLQNMGGSTYGRGSDFDFNLTPELRPNPWPVNEPDPLKRFTAIHEASTHLRSSPNFDSIVSVN